MTFDFWESERKAKETVERKILVNSLVDDYRQELERLSLDELRKMKSAIDGMIKGLEQAK